MYFVMAPPYVHIEKFVEKNERISTTAERNGTVRYRKGKKYEEIMNYGFSFTVLFFPKMRGKKTQQRIAK